MIPIRDTIPSGRVAWVTRALLMANIAAFLFEIKQGRSLDGFLYYFGVVPAHWMVSHLSDFLDWPRLFVTLLSYQFLHGSLFHLASNMLYLWIFGDNVEDQLGHARFLILYLSCGVLAALSQLLLWHTSAIPMVGASGSIAGILGAYLIMFPSARIETLVPLGFFWKTFEIPAFGFLGIWFFIQWFHGLSTIGQVADVGGVAFWAHIVGFISGIVGVFLIHPKLRF